MSETRSSDQGSREHAIRAAVITYFPMFIATLSLVTSIYNGYLNGRFIDLVKSNVERVEYMKTCKEVIDAYFNVKLRARPVGAGPEAQRSAGRAEAEGAVAVARFSALATYLANLRNERIRHEYTELARHLERTVREAQRADAAETAKRLEAADRQFTSLNDDCVRSARSEPMK